MSGPHVVLLGDSIFDNAAYVPGDPPVEAQLRAALPEGRVTLLAIDGDVVAGVAAQLRRVPKDATHLVVSVGGNDALGYVDVLTERATSVGEALLRMADIGDEFERRYRAMLDAVLARSLPAAVCTIYYPAFDEADLQRMAVAAETFFNDVILRCAFQRRVPVIDLRLVCDERADYANPIEPSARGGDKITRTIARLVREAEGAAADGARGALVYARP